ncbi:MAG: molecular chaperone DnaJ [Clostridiales bacterium]|jgi:molecular chaperone DnaJ|nr:molecular chaperone DnaJ [Clostridiales bacterium]
MAEKKDYYEILGVQRSATEDELKRAYRKLAKQYHPDANPGDKNAEAQFKQINEAYAILNDPQKKAAYDQYGHAAFDQTGGGGFYGGGGAGFDMGDIINHIFGENGFESGGFDFFGSGGGRRRSGPRRGADLQTNIQIQFDEAVFGTTRDVNLQSTESCDKCHGSGAKPGTFPETCKNCGGSGQERIQQQSIFGSMTTVRPCGVCHGEGKIIRESCPECHGAGKIRKAKTLNVVIPKGIDNGQTIRLGGKGEAGDKGGPSGDLLLTIYVQPHRLFTRQGNNLHLEAPITFVQAALGDEILIPTMEGEEKYIIKPGTQPGAIATIRGKGVPNVKNNRMVGDLIIKFNVTVPTQLSEKQKQLLREFSDEMGDEYRDSKKKWFEKILGKK